MKDGATGAEGVPPDVLRALVGLAALVTASRDASSLVEAVAETAKDLLRADSLSISRSTP